jgi:CRP/FNR family cyclic AMP-dependent transcriptional regulator
VDTAGHENADHLVKTDLFASLDERELALIANASHRRSLVRNDLLFSEGDPATEMFVVTSGRVAMARESFDGRESVLALMEPGDLFGEMPLFDHDSRSADARALKPSEVLAVPYNVVVELYAERPELLWRVVTLLSNRLRNMDDALADAMFLDVPGRTAKRVLELSGGRERFALPVTQEELAGMVGASRERVNKALSSFIRLGWLEHQDSDYVIANREALTLRSR